MEEKTEELRVKVGEKEYSQEELNQLVALGETAQEYETKWNRKVNDFYPDYTQKSQKLAEYERLEEERKAEQVKAESEQLKTKIEAGEELTPEEMRKRVIEQAREYGLITKDEFQEQVNASVSQMLEAKEIQENVEAVISENKEKGLPETTAVTLLEYMRDNGIKNPDKAYKLMFEEEIDKWKEDQLKNIKPEPIATQEGSGVGAKTPPEPQSLSRENLANAIRDSLTRGRGV